MNKDVLKIIISNRYIFLYECLLDDYFPNWEKHIDNDERFIVKYLIERFYNEYDSFRKKDLKIIESEFLLVTKQIINKLYNKVENDLILNHFTIINKL